MIIESVYEIQEWWKGTEEHKGIWVFLHDRHARLQFKTEEDALFHIMKCDAGKYQLVLVHRTQINQPIVVK